MPILIFFSPSADDEPQAAIPNSALAAHTMAIALRANPFLYLCFIVLPSPSHA